MAKSEASANVDDRMMTKRGLVTPEKGFYSILNQGPGLKGKVARVPLPDGDVRSLSCWSDNELPLLVPVFVTSL